MDHHFFQSKVFGTNIVMRPMIFLNKTRLSSIESQPKKVVVVVVIIIVVVVVDDDFNDVVVPLKFGQNWVGNRWNVAFVVVHVILVIDPTNLPLVWLKSG